MERYITFDEAVRQEVIKDGDPINLQELFSKENKTVSLSPHHTGYKVEQHFSRENGLEWFYFKDKDGFSNIYGNPTENGLILSGQIGYNNAIYNIKCICSLFANKKIGMNSRSIMEKDINLLYHKTNIIQNSFLGNLAYKNTSDVAFYGIRIADQYGVKSHYLYSSDDYSDYIIYPIRPVISFVNPSKIILDTQSKKTSGKWRLSFEK